MKNGGRNGMKNGRNGMKNGGRNGMTRKNGVGSVSEMGFYKEG